MDEATAMQCVSERHHPNDIPDLPSMGRGRRALAGWCLPKLVLALHLVGLLTLFCLSACDPDSTPGTRSMDPCEQAEDCGENRICTPDGCIEDGKCLTEEECRSTEECLDGVCVRRPPCTDDTACSADTFCSTGGDCIAQGTCVSGEDCATGTYCSVRAICIDDGTCATPNDCESGMVCDSDNQCVPGSDCGAEEFGLARMAPNVLIVFDRSCSMKNKVDGVKKWDAALMAIRQITGRFAQEVRWGLSLFPDTTDPKCEQGTISVPVAMDGANSIEALLMNAEEREHELYPSGPCVTNIDSAVKQAESDPALSDVDRTNHVLLITDGNQSGCSVDGGSNGTKEILTALHDNGITTHVVGFGGAVNKGKLSEFAVLGGAPLAGDPQYHQADAPDDLQASLQSIVGDIVGCTYTLDSAPTDLSQVYVFFDDTEKIERDASQMEGWDYDSTTQSVTFYGEACDRLKAQEVSDVDIVFGCPGPVIL